MNGLKKICIISAITALSITAASAEADLSALSLESKTYTIKAVNRYTPRFKGFTASTLTLKNVSGGLTVIQAPDPTTIKAYHQSSGPSNYSFSGVDVTKNQSFNISFKVTKINSYTFPTPPEFTFLFKIDKDGHAACQTAGYTVQGVTCKITAGLITNYAADLNCIPAS